MNLLRVDPPTLRITPSTGSRPAPEGTGPTPPFGETHETNSAKAAPWTLLCPEDVALVAADDHRRRRQLLSTLGSGDRIGLVDGRPLSRWRLRRIATASGLVIERELIVLPTLDHPIVVVDDVDTAVAYLWASVATVPPGMTRTAIPAAIALRLVRALPWSWTGALAPGRVVVGRLR